MDGPKPYSISGLLFLTSISCRYLFVLPHHLKHGPVYRIFAMLFLPRSFPKYVAVVSSFCQPIQAIHRTVGPPYDPYFGAASVKCGGQLPESYKYGHCALLIRCVLDYVDSDTSAGSQSGANIASLVPTAMSLVGMYNLPRRHVESTHV